MASPKTCWRWSALPARFFAAVTALVVAVALSSCDSQSQGKADVPTTLTLAVDSLSGSWDPYSGDVVINGISQQYDATYDTLMIWNWKSDTAEGSEPNLAEKAAVSKDRLSMRIELRNDVTFVDGTHMDARGVAAYLNALLKSKYILNGYLSPYEPKFTAAEKYVVKVTTSKPIFDAEFTRNLFAYTPILSPATIDNPELLKEGPQGSGPYRVVSFKPDDSLTFKRNPKYWNAKAFPYETVVLKAIPDPTARLNALKSGQVDATNITIAQASDAEAAKFTLTANGGFQDILIVQDPTGSSEPALRDVRVRQALMYAFDRKAIADSVYRGHAYVSSQPAMSGQANYVKGGDDRYGYDPDRARQLMAEAGYAKGFDVTIPTLATDPIAELQPVIKQYLEDIGIDVTFKSVADLGAFAAANRSGTYPLTMCHCSNTILLSMLTQTWPDGGHIVRSTPEIQKVVDTIRSGSSEASSASQRLGEFLLDQAWIIPFGAPQTLWATAPTAEVRQTNKVTEPILREFHPRS